MSLKYKGSVVLVGGGPVSAEVFASVARQADHFVAADSGADFLRAQGVIPDALIGDMDSVSAAGRVAVPAERIFKVADQDSTDFEKALGEIEAPLIYAVGFSGGRLDHELAALFALVCSGHHRVVLVGEHDVTVHLPAQIALNLPPGMRLSVFPFHNVEVGMQGLRWSFEALELHPMRKIGTSNEVAQDQVTLTSTAPGVVLILPRRALGAVVLALRTADLHSPHR